MLRYWGEDRSAGRSIPTKSIVAAGIPTGAGTDAPVVHWKPFESIWWMVTRQVYLEGKTRVLGPEEAIDRTLALELYTGAVPKAVSWKTRSAPWSPAAGRSCCSHRRPVHRPGRQPARHSFGAHYGRRANRAPRRNVSHVAVTPFAAWTQPSGIVPADAFSPLPPPPITTRCSASETLCDGRCDWTAPCGPYPRTFRGACSGRGYMAPPDAIRSDFFVLTRRPIITCPFCDPGAYWPDDVVIAQLECDTGSSIRRIRWRLSGELDLQARYDTRTGARRLVRLRGARWHPSFRHA